MKWNLVTRHSPLALAQVNELLSSLPETHRESFDVRSLKSFGDKHLELSLLEGQAPDFFTRELDQLLLEGGADLAVHSAKDLPIPLPQGLEILALTASKETRDALVLGVGVGARLKDLPRGARIGTSSPSRRDQLLAVRPDLNLLSLRGTIEERLAEVDQGNLEGIVVAYCALQRLNLSQRATVILDFETHPLQGSLGVVVASKHPNLRELSSIVSKLDVRKGWGTVAISGAGPGHPELVTRKTWSLIQTAQIIFHDALVDPTVLEGATGELVFVGKRRGHHEKTQDEINRLLYQAALKGLQVLRLKGGDPLLFGRGSEEADYLAQRLVNYEIWPGVSSASGAASFGELPLTERGVGTTVAFCLGWPKEKIQVPDTDTRVYFMAGGTLETLITRHREKGFGGELPFCLIANATLPSQKTWRLTLDQLEQRLKDSKAEPFPTPLLVITGKTVRLQGSSWWEGLPRLLYTGTNPQVVAHRPARVDHRPLIRLVDLPLDEEKTRLLRTFLELGQGWVVFTSQKTVEVFWKVLGELGLDTRALGSLRIAAVGKATAKMLALKGLVPDLVPSRESSRGLVEAFGQLEASQRGAAVLLPRSDRALDLLPKGLSQLGYQVSALVLYKNTTHWDEGWKDLDLRDYQEVFLSSPSCAQAFLERFTTLPPDIILTPMGEQTREYLTAQGVTP